MANLAQWKRPSSMMGLQREIEDVFEDFGVPRSVRRELQRLFDDFPAPQSLWRQMDRLVEDTDSPQALGSRLARVFENFLGSSRRMMGSQGMLGRGGFVPSLDLVEHDNEYVVKADLPGMREQDIDVRIGDDHTLIISGERREEESRRVRGYEYSERSYGTFTRQLELPAGSDPSKIEASFRNGVLELHVPKAETARARKIPLSRGERGERGEEPRVIAPGNGQPGQQQQNQQQQQQQQQQHRT